MTDTETTSPNLKAMVKKDIEEALHSAIDRGENMTDLVLAAAIRSGRTWLYFLGWSALCMLAGAMLK